MKGHVAVLMGGLSAEREVSLTSGKACAQALERKGYRVTWHRRRRDVAAALVKAKPDVVFNALHGRYGEDGCVQGVLDLLGIPYTHSGLLASALAMDKPMAKTVFAAAGLPLVEHRLVTRADMAAGHPMTPPYVIKPMKEGSSVGVHIVLDADEPVIEAEDWPYGECVMVERYVPGRELTVAVMGDRALGVTEIQPGERFYDYEAKYTEGRARHLVPAPVSQEVYDRAQELAIAAHRALGCRGVSRADFRYDEQGEGLVLLEVNTQPGMTPLSLVPEQAAHAGIGFDDLVEWMVEQAQCDG